MLGGNEDERRLALHRSSTGGGDDMRRTGAGSRCAMPAGLLQQRRNLAGVRGIRRRAVRLSRKVLLLLCGGGYAHHRLRGGPLLLLV